MRSVMVIIAFQYIFGRFGIMVPNMAEVRIFNQAIQFRDVASEFRLSYNSVDKVSEGFQQLGVLPLVLVIIIEVAI